LTIFFFPGRSEATGLLHAILDFSAIIIFLSFLLLV